MIKYNLYYIQESAKRALNAFIFLNTAWAGAFISHLCNKIK